MYEFLQSFFEQNVFVWQKLLQLDFFRNEARNEGMREINQNGYLNDCGTVDTSGFNI